MPANVPGRLSDHRNIDMAVYWYAANKNGLICKVSDHAVSIQTWPAKAYDVD